MHEFKAIKEKKGEKRAVKSNYPMTPQHRYFLDGRADCSKIQFISSVFNDPLNMRVFVCGCCAFSPTEGFSLWVIHTSKKSSF